LSERVVRAFLEPRSVAVIGASREPHKVGHVILRNILNSGFRGKVYPINPHADKILGLKCYPKITDVPDDVDIAIIAVPARIVPEVVEDCGKKNVPLIVVISAGFKETGPEGARLEKEIVNIAHRYGSRIVGPNCLGIMNLSRGLNATFSAITPKCGNIGLISQSGAIITALIDLAAKYGFGFSKVISLGNKADLDEVDFLKILEQDRETSIIIMYIESIERGREFIRIARQVVREKPLIVLKAGLTSRGARAVSSHTGSLAGSAQVYETALRQAGAVQVYTFRELVSALLFFSRYADVVRKLEQVEVVIVTNAGGPGIIATDLCERAGVELSSLDPELVQELRSRLPPAAALHNPVDVLGDATPERYVTVLERILARPYVSGVIVIATPQAMTNPPLLAEKLIDIARRFPEKMVVPVLLGGVSMKDAQEKLVEAGVPAFSCIEDAVSVFSMSSRYVKYRKRLAEIERVKEKYIMLDVEEIKTVIERAREEGRRVLLLHEAFEIMNIIGVPTPEGGFARSPEEAVKIAEKVGYPVVLRVVSPDILHKSDIGCVKVGLATPDEVRHAFYEIMERATRYMPHARIYGIHVSKMVKGHYEVIVGATRDPQFGPVVLFGLGGVYVELYRDVSMRVAPITELEAEEMIYETKIGTIMRGYRGSRPVNIRNIVDVIYRISLLMTQVEDILELDINPLIVSENSVYAVDVKILVR